MKRIARWLACTLLLGACASHSLEVGRPLVVAAIPTEGERLAEIRKHFPEVSGEKLTRSLAYSRSARNLFDITRHNDWTSFVPIERLVKAINAASDNPFAWVQLGAYLALNHKTEAAMAATSRGVVAAEEKCAVRACTDDLRRVRATGLINLAIYAADVERPGEALRTLMQLDWWDLPAFEQLAYHWTTARVKSALGDAEGARLALIAAAAVDRKALEETPDLRRTYPQYFDQNRDAIELYLAALAEMADSSNPCASDLAEQKALQAVELDRHVWDAYLLLSSIQFARGDYDTAITTLTRVNELRKTSREFFRPERIDYNLGNAYLARYDRTHDQADLITARDALKKAVDAVEQRYTNEDAQARRSGVFHDPDVGRFFLDALARTSPFYADASNNLGTVFERLAEQTTDSVTRQQWLAEAESQWRRALRDAYWPRRHLAYGNLAAHYAKIGRLFAAADAADAALDADPFNVVPLRALLDKLREDVPDTAAIEAAHIAGRLIGQRRSQYPIGTFDEFLEPYEKRLRELPPSAETERALIVLDYARAADDDVEKILRDACSRFPDWPWPAIEAARRGFDDCGFRGAAWAIVERFASPEVPLQNWLARREMGDVYALRADLRAQQGRYPEAQRDIERALAAGVESREIADLIGAVREALDKAGNPRVSSFAVLPFDTIHTYERSRRGHALAGSLGTIFRGATSEHVRFLERDAMDVADWSPQTAREIARLSGIGAVLTGRYATSRNLFVIDVRVLDGVTEEEVFARAYPTPADKLRETQTRIAVDVLQALRLKPNAAVQDVANAAFSADSEAYALYLAAMDILLSKPRADRRDLLRARSLLESAIRRDEGFARAHAALALAHFGLANLHERPKEVMAAAEKAAERAVALAPAAAEAQLALALARTWYSWDLDAGGAAFDEARRLGGSNSTIHRLYADYLIVRGGKNDLRDALGEKRKALELSPLSAIATLDVGWAYFYLGDFVAALAQADAALTLQPNLAAPYLLKSWIYTRSGRYDEALDALDAADARARQLSPLHLSHRIVTLLRKGEKAMAELRHRELREMAEGGDIYVLPLLEARVLVAQGDTANAYVKLRDALRDGSESMMWLPVDPWFESLHDERAFQELLADVRNGR